MYELTECVLFYELTDYSIFYDITDLIYRLYIPVVLMSFTDSLYFWKYSVIVITDYAYCPSHIYVVYLTTDLSDYLQIAFIDWKYIV